jgi:precorrin-8X/cobalt-precorrin-8 methylmutase
MRPDEIEKRSFQIIEEEAGPHQYSAAQWPIVRRVIHTTADFEYMQTMRFHPDAVSAGVEAIRSGQTIITDTNMARVGVRVRDLQKYGAAARCLMDDPQIQRIAEQQGTTRAAAAVDAATEAMHEGIYVIGNAPTALLRLIERIEQGDARPALVVGLPVGFVNAAESKAALATLDTPYITNTGRKGGSNVAASVVNALILLAGRQS